MSERAAFTILLDERSSIARHAAEGAEFVQLEGALDSPDALAAEIAHQLAERGYEGEGVMLAIASRACFAVAASADFDASVSDHQALAYMVEPYLPFTAEEITVARSGDRLQPRGGSPTSFWLTAVTAPLAEMIDALESQNVFVQAVAPVALLALQTFMQKKPDHGTLTVLWQCDGKAECFSVVGGSVCQWFHLPAEPLPVRHALGMLALAEREPAPVISIGLSESLRESLAQIAGLHLSNERSCDLRDAAVNAASGVLAGTALPLADLRVGPLAPRDRYRLIRGPLRLAMVGAVLLFVASAAAMLARAHRLRAMADALHASQEAVFRVALPGQPIPPGIASRLRSELSKLTIATGDIPSGGPRPAASALESMRRFLAALPAEVKYRLSDIRLDGAQLNIDGEMLSHAEADKLATCLREQGFDVQPPRSQQRADETIGVHWSAELLAAASKTPSTHR